MTTTTERELRSGGIESRYDVRYGGTEEQVHGLIGFYTDDLRDAVALDEKYGVKAVVEGHCDYEDVGPGHPQYRGIDGTIRTRRQGRVIPREEWQRAARILDVYDKLVGVALGERNAVSPGLYVSGGAHRPYEERDLDSTTRAALRAQAEQIVNLTTDPTTEETT